ncbi:ABC transporter substrate-binding protein [Streptomyces sp. NPDC050560]|uniref:ABC transporter substrate-binding protein n=1 Tax=Streptomyces sp. NPDC050560 TaxID=3365630 RepID=UPI0037909F2B
MRHGVLAAGLVVTGLILTACGNAPTTQAGGGSSAASDPYADYASLTGKARTDKLLADAKKDGSVLDLYTSNTDIQDLVSGFKKAYPQIKVNAFRANSETVLQRVTQENQANKPQNDVVDTNDLELREMDKAHLLKPYDGPSKDDLREEATGLGGWTAERFNAFVVGWNTSVVHKGQEPKNFTELADPKWKGKLSMEVGDWDWYAAMHTYLTEKKGMSDSAVNDLFKKIVANAKVTKGHTVQGELLSAGQFGVALSVYSHTIDQAAKKGAPVAWRPAVEPVILRPNGVALMTRARHPAAALLWVDWVLGDGQKAVTESERIPAAKHVPGEKDPIPADATVYSLPKTAETDGTKWSDAYDALLRGVPTAH